MIRLRGFAHTPRMAELGITGMWNHSGQWFAEFDRYPNMQFPMPRPIVEWLLPEEETAA